jgi:hypothetical protein
MATVKLNSDGKVILTNGKASCTCCGNCYFPEFENPSDPPKFYKTKTTIYNYNWTGDDGCLKLSVSGNSMYVETCVNGELQMTCSGNAHSTATEYTNPPCGGEADCYGSFVDCVWQESGIRCEGWGTNPNGPSSGNQTETIVSTTKIEITQPPWYIMSGTGTGTIQLSDEV